MGTILQTKFNEILNLTILNLLSSYTCSTCIHNACIVSDRQNIKNVHKVNYSQSTHAALCIQVGYI
jgi:hypothetical protein